MRRRSSSAGARAIRVLQVAVALCAVGSLGLPAAPAGAEEPVAPAGAEEPAPLDGATLFQQRTCIACHGHDAKTPILPEYPRLAGQNAAYALQQMRDIKSGARANGNTPAMRGVMHLVTDAELQVLAEYLQSLREEPPQGE